MESLKTYMAKVVVKGYDLKHVFNYEETFS